MSSVQCQRQLISALVDVAVDANDLQSAKAAVSCLKQVFMLCRSNCCKLNTFEYKSSVVK